MPTANRTEYLAIGSVPLSTAAWWTLDLSGFWGGPAQKGGDRDVPHVDGATAYLRRKAPLVVTVNMIIIGQYDTSGAAVTVANQRKQLYTNVAYIRDNVVDPVGSGDGTRAATLHLPDGTTTLTGNVHVIGPLQLAPISATRMRASFDVSIPAGELT